jgi:hypothetical protein
MHHRMIAYASRQLSIEPASSAEVSSSVTGRDSHLPDYVCTRSIVDRAAANGSGQAHAWMASDRLGNLPVH